MRKLDGALMSFAVMAGSALFASTAADAYSSKVKDACAGDYQNFCAQYMPDNTELCRCFEKQPKSLAVGDLNFSPINARGEGSGASI